MKLHPCCICDAPKCSRCGLGKLHDEPASAQVAPEMLAKQHLDVRLVVNHENEQAHARSPISEGKLAHATE